MSTLPNALASLVDPRYTFEDRFPNAFEDRFQYEQSLKDAIYQAHEGAALAEEAKILLGMETTGGTSPVPSKPLAEENPLSEENLLSFVDAFKDGEVSMIEATDTIDQIVNELLRLRRNDFRSASAVSFTPAPVRTKTLPPDDPYALMFMVALKRMGGRMEITDGERMGWTLDEEVEASRNPNDYVTEYRLVKKKKW